MYVRRVQMTSEALWCAPCRLVLHALDADNEEDAAAAVAADCVTVPTSPVASDRG
jgi:hypothetical protein